MINMRRGFKSNGMITIRNKQIQLQVCRDDM